MIIGVFTFIVCLSYLLLVSLMIIGWWATPVFNKKGNGTKSCSVSVVVACKNEELHLPTLLSAIFEQSFTNFELILVDDHSSDGTLELMLDYQARAKVRIKVLESEGSGKKKALQAGIEAASGDLIVTTDADCLPGKNWLMTIVQFYMESSPDLVICPVRLETKKGCFYELQALEFGSLVAAGLGLAGFGFPVLCNGANLAFPRSVWLNCNADLREDELSGDDIFLLHSIKKKKGLIQPLMSESATVTTQAVESVGDFIHQRRRWASKAPGYRDWQSVLTALIVFSISALMVTLLFCSFFSYQAFSLLLMTWIFKVSIDIAFLSGTSSLMGFQHLKRNALMLSLVYPFYISGVALLSIISRPKSW